MKISISAGNLPCQIAPSILLPTKNPANKHTYFTANLHVSLEKLNPQSLRTSPLSSTSIIHNKRLPPTMRTDSPIPPDKFGKGRLNKLHRNHKKESAKKLMKNFRGMILPFLTAIMASMAPAAG